MKKFKELSSIGTVNVNGIALSDTLMSLYIPVEKESDFIKEKRELYESCVMKTMKLYQPEINTEGCTLFTETNLYVSTGYADENGKYQVDYSVSFYAWLEDAEGNAVYDDISDQIEIKLSDEDKAYIKKILIMKIINALM